MTQEIFRPRLSNGVVKFAELVGTITDDITVDAYLAIPVYTDELPDSNAFNVELDGYLVRHNTYVIHPLNNFNPIKLNQQYGLYITDEQTGLNIFLQLETIDSVSHLYLCGDSRVLRKLILTTTDTQNLQVVNMELFPTQEVMIEREDIMYGTDLSVVLPTVSELY